VPVNYLAKSRRAFSLSCTATRKVYLLGCNDTPMKVEDGND
jgi:hypothetical protein